METESATTAKYLGDSKWSLLIEGERFCAYVPFGAQPEVYLRDIHSNLQRLNRSAWGE